MSHVRSKSLYSPSNFSWAVVNTAWVSFFFFNVLQNAAAFAVEDRSCLSSASSVSLMIPSLSALIIASKSILCFSLSGSHHVLFCVSNLHCCLVFLRYFFLVPICTFGKITDSFSQSRRNLKIR